MALYVVDTGVLLGYARAAAFARYVDDQYSPTQPPNSACVSVVSVGEIKCFPIRRSWGQRKREELASVLQKIPVVPINHPPILQRYAEIVTYCEGKNPVKPLPAGTAARPMRGNDAWIAATASVINAKLITTDTDFLLLDGVFLRLICVDPKQK